MSPSSIGTTCAFCQDAATLKCSACVSVHYCNKQHQRLDWPKHRLSCRNYEFGTSDQGHYVVASRDIKAGEVIVTEAPLIMGPRFFTSRAIFCIGCCRPLGTEVVAHCPRCSWPACQSGCPGLTDKARHGNECAYFGILLAELKTTEASSNIRSAPMEAILPLRCFLLSATDTQKWKILEEILQPETSTPHDVLSGIAATVSFVTKAISLIENAFQVQLENTALETTRRIFSFLLAKCIGIISPKTDLRTRPILAVYAVTSRLEHNCMPNTQLIFEEVDVLETKTDKWRGRITVQAYKNIRKGERITTAVVEPYKCTFERQQTLMVYRNVSCSCARCKDPTELGLHAGSLKCTECGGWLLPKSPSKIESSVWECQHCNNKVSSHWVCCLLDFLNKRVHAIRWEKIPTVEEKEKLLAELGAFLHPRHALCTMVKGLLCKMYGYEPGKSGLEEIALYDLKRKAALCSEVLDVHLNPVIQCEEYLIAEPIREKVVAEKEILRRIYCSGQLKRTQVELFRKEHENLIRRALCIVPHHHPMIDELSAKISNDYATLLSWTNTD